MNSSQMAKDIAHTAYRACTPVDRSQVAKDTAPATQHTSGHTGNQEPSGQGHSTHRTQGMHTVEQERSGQRKWHTQHTARGHR